MVNRTYTKNLKCFIILFPRLYIRRFSILMALVKSKSKIETTFYQAFPNKSNSNMLFDPKFEESVSKWLSSKSKPRELFELLNQQQQQLTSHAPKDARKQSRFPRLPLF